jgi:hypothetical protein
MNLTYAAKIRRPQGVSDSDPLLVPAHNPLPLHMKVKKTNGGKYTGLASAHFWVTVKSDLTVADGSAEIHLEQGETGDPFTIVSAASGLLDCVIPGSVMATLVVGTVYYIDVQILDGSQPYTILYDRIRPYQQVTKASS